MQIYGKIMQIVARLDARDHGKLLKYVTFAVLFSAHTHYRMKNNYLFQTRTIWCCMSCILKCCLGLWLSHSCGTCTAFWNILTRKRKVIYNSITNKSGILKALFLQFLSPSHSGSIIWHRSIVSSIETFLRVHATILSCNNKIFDVILHTVL